MYNRHTLIGHVGKDLVLESTKGGTPTVAFSIATKNYKKETDWHNVRAFGKAAETLVQYVKKGDLLMVEGPSATQTWEKDGQRREKTELTVQEFKFFPRGDGAKGGSRTSAPASAAAPDLDDGSDIPF